MFGFVVVNILYDMGVIIHTYKTEDRITIRVGENINARIVIDKPYIYFIDNEGKVNQVRDYGKLRRYTKRWLKENGTI